MHWLPLLPSEQAHSGNGKDMEAERDTLNLADKATYYPQEIEQLKESNGQ
jgi:hypothetical protein